MLVIRGHEGPVDVLGFSPNGRRIASAGRDHRVKVWDSVTGRELANWTHTKDKGASSYKNASFCYSSDGRRLVWSTGDQIVRISDAETGLELAMFSAGKESVCCVAYSPDGKTIAVGGTRGTVRLWDAASLRQLRVLESSYLEMTSVAFSVDGKRLASMGWVWELDSGQLLGSGRAHSIPVSPPTVLWRSDWMTSGFSPDGRRIASPRGDTTLRVLDAESGRELLILVGHGDTPTSAAYSPDGRRIVSTGLDGSVRVWDATTGRQLSVMWGHEFEISSVAFDPNGRRIVSGGGDGTIRVWNAQATLGNDKSVRGSDRLFFDREGLKALTDGEGDVLSIRDFQTSRVLSSGLALSGGYWNFFSSDCRRIVELQERKTLRIWDTASGILTPVLQGHVGEILDVTFSLDGRTLATAGEDKSVRVWDAVSGKPVCILHGHQSKVTVVTFSPDGQLIASGGEDKTIRIWDWRSSREIGVIHGLPSTAELIGFSPDARIVAASNSIDAEADRWLRTWDAGSLRELLNLPGLTLGFFGYRTTAFSPDGRRIIARPDPATVHLRDPETGREIATIRGHHGRIDNLVFTPDGQRIATGGSDGTVRLWDSETGRELVNLLDRGVSGHLPNIMSLSFSPDGRRLAANNLMGAMWVWDFAPSGPETRSFREAQNLARVHIDSSHSETDYLDRIAHDSAVSEVVRAQGLKLATGLWAEEVAIREEAKKQAEEANRQAEEANRQEANSQSRALNEASWEVVKLPGTTRDHIVRPFARPRKRPA